MMDRTALRKQRQCRYLEHLHSSSNFMPLVKPEKGTYQKQPYDIIKFDLTKQIDKLRVSFDFRHYQTIKDRLSQRLEPKPTHRHDSGLYQDYCLGESTLSLITWEGNTYRFSLELHDASHKNQLFLINNILKDTPRTISLVEYAYILTPKLKCELEELRQIIETGLTFTRATGVGFRRIENTSYYATDGYIRHHYTDDGKRHTTSAGMRIYFIPKDGESFDALKIEVVYHRTRLKQSVKPIKTIETLYAGEEFLPLEENETGLIEYTEPLTHDDNLLERNMTYRMLDKEKLFRTHRMRLEGRKSNRKRKKSKLNFHKHTYTNAITSTINPCEMIYGENRYAAAIPIQMHRLSELLDKEFENNSRSFFPTHPKQLFIFDDIKNGFVRTCYSLNLFCQTCDGRRCETEDPIKINIGYCTVWDWSDGFSA